MPDCDRSGLPKIFKRLLRINDNDSCDDVAYYISAIESQCHKDSLRKLASIVCPKQARFFTEESFDNIPDPTLSNFAKVALRRYKTYGNNCDSSEFILTSVLSQILDSTIIGSLKQHKDESVHKILGKLEEAKPQINTQLNGWALQMMNQGKYVNPNKKTLNITTQLI